MKHIYLLAILCITIEIVFSGPLFERSLFKRGRIYNDNRRGIEYGMNDPPFASRRGIEYDVDYVRKNYAYKRNNVNYNKYGVPTSLGKRAVVRTSTQTWPGGVIPYDMSNMKSEDQQTILESMKRISDDTGKVVDGNFRPCITFVPKRADDDTWIIFQYGQAGDCSAHVGYWQGRNNAVTLGDGCMYYNVIQHELMHVIGFEHEQNNPDRDQYIQVFFDNIDPNMVSQFQKIEKTDAINFNIPYDVNSIMQYRDTAFQKPGFDGKTMQSLDPNNPIPEEVIDRRLSPYDVSGVRQFYQCPS